MTDPKHAPNTDSDDDVTDDQRIDEAMEDTFPASDPPSHTGIVGPGGIVKPGSE